VPGANPLQPAPLTVIDVGRIPYAEALALQLSLVQAVAEGRASDTLLVCQHPPVITLGRASTDDDVPDRQALARAGIPLHEVSRGGRATYHGPGQVVGYPIFDLCRARGHARSEADAAGSPPDLHAFVAGLETALCRAVGHWGIAAEGIAGRRGVWVGNRKLASIGVAVRGRVSYHGFALNVDCDLSPFSLIVPCGIADAAVTSMALETGRALDRAAIVQAVTAGLSAEFGYRAAPGLVPARLAGLTS
jgi:lipoyl(octanoyl) transferase